MTKQELKDYYWLKLNITKLEQRIEELESIATKQTTRIKNDADARGGHGVHDRLGDIVAEIDGLRTEIQVELSKSYATAARIEKAIADLPAREKYLIRARYVDLKNWEQICVDMNYDWSHVHRIHAGALKILA